MAHKGSLVPAYGRDYSSAQEALKDWLAGKDFRFMNITSDGTYCSIADFKRSDTLELRYSNLTKFTIVSGNQ